MYSLNSLTHSCTASIALVRFFFRRAHVSNDDRHVFVQSVRSHRINVSLNVHSKWKYNYINSSLDILYFNDGFVFFFLFFFLGSNFISLNFVRNSCSMFVQFVSSKCVLLVCRHLPIGNYSKFKSFHEWTLARPIKFTHTICGFVLYHFERHKIEINAIQVRHPYDWNDMMAVARQNSNKILRVFRLAHMTIKKEETSPMNRDKSKKKKRKKNSNGKKNHW